MAASLLVDLESVGTASGTVRYGMQRPHIAGKMADSVDWPLYGTVMRRANPSPHRIPQRSSETSKQSSASLFCQRFSFFSFPKPLIPWFAVGSSIPLSCFPSLPASLSLSLHTFLSFLPLLLSSPLFSSLLSIIVYSPSSSYLHRFPPSLFLFHHPLSIITSDIDPLFLDRDLDVRCANLFRPADKTDQILFLVVASDSFGCPRITMCPMMLNSLSDGPAMVLSPSQEHAFLQFPRQHKLNGVSQSSGSFFSNGCSTSFGAKPTASGPMVGKPSRKRSRDEAAFEEAMNTPSVPSIPARAPPAQKEELVYGEGMVLLNPRTGLALSADSQTGTWYEESLASTAAAPSVSSHFQTGPSNTCGRKSQRLDPSAPKLDDIALSSIQRLRDNGKDDAHRLLDATNRSPDEPLVDDATRLLGISWQRIAFDGDGDMAAAVRGWKKYIDKQFSRGCPTCHSFWTSKFHRFLPLQR